MADLFLHDDFNNYAKHEVATGIDDKTARELVEANKAVEIKFGEYESYKKRADQLTSEYKKAIKRIEADTHPLMTDDVRKYEKEKAYIEYEKASKELGQEWDAKHAEMQAIAKHKAANAYIKVNEEDEKKAHQIANRLALSIKTAPDKLGLEQAIKNAKETVDQLSDTERTALQSYFDKVDKAISEKPHKINTDELYRSLAHTDNLDIHAEKIAKFIPDSVSLLGEYRRIKSAKRR